MDNHSGKTGETYVVDLLEQRGCRALCRNYHSRFDEIDIITRGGGYLVSIKIKTRGKRHFGVPQETVTASKWRRLILTISQYLSGHDSGLQPRFDVAVVRTDGVEQVALTEHFENAFDTEDCFA